MNVKHVAISLMLLSVGIPAAWAETVVLTSKQPYWTVGARDMELSRECALGRFNLQRADRLVARFTGKEGAETLGVAKGTGVNLRDPGHKAKPNEDYFFRNQNTTSCEVFVGGRKGGTPPSSSSPTG
jgi:hypothetical protein